MKKICSFIVLLAFFCGCASQIMRSYIGKDVRIAMLDYGPPVNAFDMGDGRRAFQWVFTSSHTRPARATTTGFMHSYGNVSWVNSNTTITGGQTVNTTCVYTVFGRWDQVTRGWIITDFKQPDLMCE